MSYTHVIHACHTRMSYTHVMSRNYAVTQFLREGTAPPTHLCLITQSHVTEEEDTFFPCVREYAETTQQHKARSPSTRARTYPTTNSCVCVCVCVHRPSTRAHTIQQHATHLCSRGPSSPLPCTSVGASFTTWPTGGFPYIRPPSPIGLSLCVWVSLSLSRSLSHSLTLSLARSLSPLSLGLALARARSLALMFSCSLSLAHSLSLSPFLSHAHGHADTQTRMYTQTRIDTQTHMDRAGSHLCTLALVFCLASTLTLSLVLMPPPARSHLCNLALSHAYTHAHTHTQRAVARGGDTCVQWRRPPPPALPCTDRCTHTCSMYTHMTQHGTCHMLPHTYVATHTHCRTHVALICPC